MGNHENFWEALGWQCKIFIDFPYISFTSGGKLDDNQLKALLPVLKTSPPQVSISCASSLDRLRSSPKQQRDPGLNLPRYAGFADIRM